ncbi:MAG: hypothetical protein KGO53_09310 [Alphaproteobacteria bacterium]|nr:hypothetical protein [Alphaproteobacteria bacterium]
MSNGWAIETDGWQFKASKGREARGLLICLSGFKDHITQALKDYCEELQQVHFTGVDMAVFSCFQSKLSGELASEAVIRLVKRLDQLCLHRQYDEIVFLSHGFSAPVARKALIITKHNCDGYDSELEDEYVELSNNSDRTWHNAVKEIVFASGNTRGWLSSPRWKPADWLIYNFYGWVAFVYGVLGVFASAFGDAKLIFGGQSIPIIYQLRRGAPFIFNTRMQWLDVTSRPLQNNRLSVDVTHMLPTDDRMISAIEIIDIEMSFKQTSEVMFVEIQDTNQDTILDLFDKKGTGAANLRENKKRAKRRELILACVGRSDRSSPFFMQNRQILKAHEIPLKYLDDSVNAKPDRTIRSFVFVIHGIRDTGAWAKKIASHLRIRDDHVYTPVGKLRTDTQSYGYFAALPFLLPWVRRTKVEWLMDRFATARALYPEAEMHFIGHSNGTYLAATAMRDYLNCKFERVIFAGSVVKSKFDWQPIIEAKRIRLLLNYKATADWVVAFLPKAIGRLTFGALELGGAGHDGFSCDDSAIRNVGYAIGGHSAALDDNNWQEFADFIVKGAVPPASRNTEQFAPHRSTWFTALVQINFLFPLAIALTFVFVEDIFISNLLNLNDLFGFSKLQGFPRLSFIKTIYDSYGSIPGAYKFAMAAAFNLLTYLSLFRL